MCEAMPGWRRRTLSGGLHLTETTDVPPEGFVRLAPVPREAAGSHLSHAGPGVVVVLSLLAVVTASMAILQRLMLQRLMAWRRGEWPFRSAESW
jgi:hypothetical protein